jgi:HTH-type transcriptional regulator, transcriptional repressor of NAD biosynthesis genes
MPKSIVLMTALVPTIGHEALVNFASNISLEDTHVIISGRSFEPVALEDRVSVFKEALWVGWVHGHMDDDAPQTPTGPDDIAFWDYWKNVVRSYVGHIGPDDFVVASEPYGMKMAEVLGCKFMPFDLDRSYVTARGTNVRCDLDRYWVHIMPAFRRRLKKTVTFFGSESCGKTTMTKNMARMFGSRYTVEWARPYLELVGPEITEEKMAMIVEGQYALQQTAFDNVQSFFTFQDTDLLSTIGYYRIIGMKPPSYLDDYFMATKSDLYIVMNDQIPFEQDILRYGGDKRTSDSQFWVDLLWEYECAYEMVERTNKSDQISEVFSMLMNYQKSVYDPIERFVRN